MVEPQTIKSGPRSQAQTEPRRPDQKRRPSVLNTLPSVSNTIPRVSRTLTNTTSKCKKLSSVPKTLPSVSKTPSSKAGNHPGTTHGQILSQSPIDATSDRFREIIYLPELYPVWYLEVRLRQSLDGLGIQRLKRQPRQVQRRRREPLDLFVSWLGGAVHILKSDPVLDLQGKSAC